jgi:hypothetical protein
MLVVVEQHPEGVHERAYDVVELFVPQHGVQQGLLRVAALVLRFLRRTRQDVSNQSHD